jgi:hypothetical protein
LKVNIRRRIKVNGREYSDRRDLPPDLRAAYKKATTQAARGLTKEKFVINGHEFESEDAMPADVRTLCRDIMGVIENNGEVTLPSSRPARPDLTSRKSLLFFASLAVMLAAAIYLVLHYAR